MKRIRGFTIDDSTLYAEETPDIVVYSPFGHLGEKYVFLMYRLHYINDTIKELYDLNLEYFNLKKNHEFDNNMNLKILHRALRFSMEIKVIIDEMISLYYILYYYKNNNNWPTQIAVDSIGRYLDTKNTIRFELFEKYTTLFEKINSIGNAVKHSFSNSEITWLRNNTSIPLLLAYYHKQNDLKNQIEFHYIELPKFIDEFNVFLDDYRHDIRCNYSQQPV